MHGEYYKANLPGGNELPPHHVGISRLAGIVCAAHHQYIFDLDIVEAL